MNDSNHLPLISIIIPIYNAETYLANCIKSVINQDFSQFELILIDDGSTDNSLDIIKSFSKNSRIIYQSIPNAGVSNARNLGLKLSKGEYIMFVDADDWLEPKTLSKCFYHSSKHNLDVLFFSWFKTDSHNKRKVTTLEENSIQIINNNVSWLKNRCIGLMNGELSKTVPIDLYNTPWAKLYKSSVINDNSINFKPRHFVGMEDVLFNIELFQKVNFIGYLNEYLYNYRIDSDNSLTKTDVDKMDWKLKNLIQEIKNIKASSTINEVLTNRIRLSLINILVSLTSKHRSYSFFKKVSYVKKVLNDEFYYSTLKYSFTNASFRYKVFFILCKRRSAFFLTSLLVILNRVR